MFDFLTKGRLFRYLSNKARGGEINQRGNAYEQHYACFKICQFAENHAFALNKVVLSSQEFAFIDDLYISVGNQDFYYYQLKTSAVLSWNYRKNFASLKIDFLLQEYWCKWKKERFYLHLVVSNKDVYADMLATKPTAIAGVYLENFVYAETVSLLLANSTPFRKSVASVCAINSPTLDKLAAVAASIIGIWSSSNKKGINLNEFLKTVQGINGSFVKYPLLSNAKIAPQLDAILKGIPGFYYHIDNNYFIWEYGLADTGNLPYEILSPEFTTFGLEVVQANPATFEDLEPFLN
jgi:hypothetical protein